MIDDDTGATTEQLDRQALLGDRVLLVIDGAALQVVPLPITGILTIGRSSRCDVMIDSGSVSRHHANLTIHGEIEIVDVGSSNGTLVDGARLSAGHPVRLAIGVPFLIGAVTLMVQTRAARREPPAAESVVAALDQAASRLAVGQLCVLIAGETGVGKKRFAERIHGMSPRRGHSFVRINCTAISEPALEIELFGSDLVGKLGLVELAHGGTALLSDVDQLPPGLQHKLLRVIEDGAVRRVGGSQAWPVDVRYLASSSKDLAGQVEQGRFRRDLYFRIAGATIAIPPLRDRRAEIVPLAEQFIAAAAAPMQRTFALSEDAQHWLIEQAWPGNIRELRNACERAVLLASGAWIERRHLTMIDDPAAHPPTHRHRAAATVPPPPGIQAPSAADMPSQVRATVAELERRRIIDALERCAGNQTRAAELLGVSRRTLINRLDEYGIARPRKRDE